MSNYLVTVTSPTKRVGKPGEVADLVMWLASNDASYVSGSNFSVDGPGLG